MEGSRCYRMLSMAKEGIILRLRTRRKAQIIMNDREEKIIKLLNSIKLNLNCPTYASRSDKEYMKIIQAALESNNLATVYKGISILERSPIFFRGADITSIINKVYIKSGSILGKWLSELNHLKAWYFLNYCCTDRMLYYFIDLNLTNDLFNYECVRTLMNKNLDKNDIYVKVAIIRISNRSPFLLKQWVREYDFNARWYQILIDILPKLNKKALKVIALYIDIDRMVEETRFKGASSVVESLDEVESKKLFEVIGNIIIKKWNKSLNRDKLSLHSIHFFSIVLSNYSNWIIRALFFKLSNSKEYIEQLKKSTKELNKDMSKWYSNIVIMRDYFFYNLTKIYYLLCLKKHFDVDLIVLNEILKNILFILNKYGYLWGDSDKELVNKTMFKNLLLIP